LDERERLNTSIRIAAREDRLEDLKRRLGVAGANINSQSEDGVTALMYASRGCYPKVVRYLLRQGADVNVSDKSGRNALMYATRALCLPAVKSLLKSPDIQVKMRDHRGRSVLHYARLAAALEVDGPAIEMLRLLKSRFKSEGKR
jgi:ankyrin repeat protein